MRLYATSAEQSQESDPVTINPVLVRDFIRSLSKEERAVRESRRIRDACIREEREFVCACVSLYIIFYLFIYIYV